MTNENIVKQFLESRFSDQIGQWRKYFVENTEDDSVEKPTGNAHIIYFQPFLNYDMVITNVPTMNNGTFQIRIKPAAWAQAFIQLDLTSTTEYLMKAIVHSDVYKVISVDITARFNTAQIILYAAVWQMSKFQEKRYIDPWSFPLNFQEIMQLPQPTEVQSATIMNALRRSHSTVNVRCPAEPLPEMEQNLNTIASGLSSNFWDLPVNDPLMQFVAEAMEEQNKYDRIFREFMTLYLETYGGYGGNKSQVNTARIAAALTKSTIPTNTDQIVDAFQISKLRMAEAARSRTIAKIAGKISSATIRLDFKNRTFSTIDDICPVKLLAIYRGAKFLQNRLMITQNGDPVEFNSEIPEHNDYPTIEECRDINKELELNAIAVLARLARIRLNQMNLYGMADDYMDVIGNNDDQTGQASYCNIQSVDPKTDESSSFSLPNIDQQYVDKVQEPNMHLLPNKSSTQEQDCDTEIAEPLNSLSGISQESNINFRSTGGTGGLLEDSNQLTICQINLNQFKTLSITGGIQPILNDPNFSDSVTIIAIKSKEKVNGVEVSVSRSHAFSSITWTDAENLYKEQGAITVGKDVLRKLFTENELKECTPSGKKKGKRLDMNRQRQLLDCLRFLIEKVPLNSTMTKCESWSLALEGTLMQKVLHEGTSQIRNPKINKPKPRSQSSKKHVFKNRV